MTTVAVVGTKEMKRRNIDEWKERKIIPLTTEKQFKKSSVTNQLSNKLRSGRDGQLFEKDMRKIICKE